MFRNMFNEPKPASEDELIEAINERAVEVSLANATIAAPDPMNSAPFIGWTAEISATDDDGENGIETAGFEVRAELIAALHGAGIRDIYDENGDRI